MAELRTPSPSQLAQARDALLPLVRGGIDGESSPLWRAAHAALCQVESAMGVACSVPPREQRRKDPSAGK
jgi:hypothetical protein